VWGSMCISWSNEGDLSGEDSPWVSLGCLPYLSYLTRDKENTMLQGISSVTMLSIRD
jgi:hypothetical protein